MSANAWMIEREIVTSTGSVVDFNIIYIGPDWDNEYDPPSTRLSDIAPAHLTIWASYPQEHDNEDLYKECLNFMVSNETTIIKEIIESNEPADWYWDT